jgi:hypothetical protein
MNLSSVKLLSFGYLPKELPPAFCSVSLGAALPNLVLPKPTHTKCVTYSIPKGQFSRRNLQIPHPFGFIQLVQHLAHPPHCVIMRDHNAKCSISMSFVRENEKPENAVTNEGKRAIINRYPSLRRAKRAAILSAYDKLFLVKVDISQYYPSVYTHTLSWALLGRERAKELLRMPKAARQKEVDFALYAFADELDRLIRQTQDNQSVGIPIGPDTSHIISELIGCYFDQRLQSRFQGIRAFRYFDDFEIYVDGEEKAQEVLRFVQEILAEFQLSVSEAKAQIKRFPFEFEDAWVREINAYPFYAATENNIRQYFSLIFGLVDRHPDRATTVVKYALTTFERRTLAIKKANWPIFESLLLKTALIRPSCLEQVSRILETYRSMVDASKVGRTLIGLLNVHAPLNHHFEVVWALWMLKQFNIRLPLNLVPHMVAGGNALTLLVLFDLESNGLVEGGAIDPVLRQQIIASLDSGEDSSDWLLYYEAVQVKGWLLATARAEYQTLRTNGVTFYDQNATINTYPEPPVQAAARARFDHEPS